jgi:hypothetical protein
MSTTGSTPELTNTLKVQIPTPTFNVVCDSSTIRYIGSQYAVTQEALILRNEGLNFSTLCLIQYICRPWW